ncbi:hypothetical protein GH714_008993 [Hevea brasiliensis]|uniref:Uncharacterized protein n=1 Tax=Hevea brasiliensis TaxID=3981 RepID=A0A6A6LTB7_HEVBR|nr:hypothetical protein GH714_008993 [Hevea brasiliensis]
MPRSIYALLNLGPLENAGVIIQLADRSNVYPDGVLDDVLVQVNELVFPTDFYVLDTEGGYSSISSPILLGKPFLKTSRTNIDVNDSSITMEFDDMINDCVDEIFVLGDEVILKVALCHDLKKEDITNSKVAFAMSKDLEENVVELHHSPLLRYEAKTLELHIYHTKLFRAIVYATKLKLKLLLNHQKYVYLGKDETLPIIISKKLTLNQEERLI